MTCPHTHRRWPWRRPGPGPRSRVVVTRAADGGLLVRRVRGVGRGRDDLLDHPAGSPVADLGHDGDGGGTRPVVCTALAVGAVCGLAVGGLAPVVGVLAGVGAAVAVLVAGTVLFDVALPVGVRPVPSHRVAAPESRRLRAAVHAARRVVGVWPELSGLVQPDDPTAVLHRSLWDLAGVLADHGRLRAHHADLRRTLARLPAGADALRGELGHRLDQVTDLLDARSRDVDARVGRLRRLAEELTRSARDQRAVAAARELAAESDRVLGAVVPAMPDEVCHLTERTCAVLAAWRDLTEPAGVDGV